MSDDPPVDIAWIRAHLRRRAPSPAALADLERAGEPAFDAIVGVLESDELTVRERASALHALVLLARESCAHRKADVFEWALRTTRSEDVDVRSEAALLVSNYVAIVELVGHVPDARRRAATVLAEALARGLSRDVARIVTEMLGGE